MTWNTKEYSWFYSMLGSLVLINPPNKVPSPSIHKPKHSSTIVNVLIDDDCLADTNIFSIKIYFPPPLIFSSDFFSSSISSQRQLIILYLCRINKKVIIIFQFAAFRNPFHLQVETLIQKYF